MGYGMAAHLVQSGYAVTGFDVYQPALDRFLKEGKAASAAKTPKEAVHDVDVLICMVATSAQATPLLFDAETGAVQGLKANATIIMCSTVAPAYIDELQSRLKEAGRSDLRLIDSPVSGGAGRAADGTLSIFASGAKEDVETARAVLQCMSGKLYEIPGGLGGGSNAKMIHQVFAGIYIAMANEAMGLAAAAGLDTREVFEKLKGSEASSWMFENRVPPMLDAGLGRYSAITIIAKDVVCSSPLSFPPNLALIVFLLPIPFLFFFLSFPSEESMLFFLAHDSLFLSVHNPHKRRASSPKPPAPTTSPSPSSPPPNNSTSPPSPKAGAPKTTASSSASTCPLHNPISSPRKPVIPHPTPINTIT